eukprot:Sspe_Gene.24645::Locus_9800_Transcript_1_1_Confidence_1.000_Length_3366::g.24645::m.24645
MPPLKRSDGNVSTDEDGAAVKGRGEYLFYRPEWKRPWRTKRAQRHADVVVEKERAIEVYVHKNAVLRRQLEHANDTLQRAAMESAADVQHTAAEKDKEIAKLRSAFNEAVAEASHREMMLQRQIQTLERQHREAMTGMEEKLKAVNQRQVEASEEHSRVVAQMGNMGRHEVKALQSIIEAKDKELAATREKHKEEMKQHMEHRDQNASGLLKQLQDLENHWRKAMDEQVERSNELRGQDLSRIETLQSTITELQDKVANYEKKIATLEKQQQSSEQVTTTWCTRMLSQIDTMFDTLGAPRTASSAAPPASAPEAKAAGPMAERVWQQLVKLGDLQSKSREELRSMRSKVSDTDHMILQSDREQREKWEERRRELLAMQHDMEGVMHKQERLAKAFEEVKQHSTSLEGKEKYLVHCLRFLLDDYRRAEQFRTSTNAVPPPQSGKMAVVSTAVENSDYLWKTDFAMMKDATALMTDILRSKMLLHGGYEARSKGDSFTFLFPTTLAACQFALDIQVSMTRAPWQESLLKHTDPEGTSSVWRGLRPKVSVHFGEVKAASRVGSASMIDPQYHGPAVFYSTVLLGVTAGGQIVLSGSAWNEIQFRLDELPENDATSLGMHAVSAAKSHTTEAQLKDHLMQLLPRQLSGRAFASIAQVEAEGVTQRQAETICDTLSLDVEAYRKHSQDQQVALEALAEELDAVGQVGVAAMARLRELQHNRPWNPDDLIGVLGTLDQLMLRHDTTVRNLQFVIDTMNGIKKGQDVLKQAVAVHNSTVMTEAEYRHELTAMKQRHAEEICALEAHLKADAQKLLLQASRQEESMTGLRQQMNSGMVEFLQKELAKMKHTMDDEIKARDSTIQRLEERLQHERSLTRFQQVPSCATPSKARRGSAASWARSPWTRKTTAASRAASPSRLRPPLLSPGSSARAHSTQG